ncbi:AfsR/SARP family transcriptional regulator [Streptomyces pactum]|uniref:AfsR/SARP family transcriptional regulator n=1 Tax=Streptomyces pactum TaxID=68249 RepID=A0ABS0NUF9_9ACTN|nr:AfsR/SARP family transcriptional regulator [Streptomyces pactum]MBH5338846.1 AfsR/SARP family transcriptional regulator [Streptomyces pactum]
MRYLILGATEARDSHGQPLPLGAGARLRALLTALALRAARALPVPVDVLIGEVWADDPPQDPPAALQALVGRLRRVVGRAAVDSGPGGYRLVTPADEVDLFRFERLVGEGSRALDSGDAETAAGTLRAALALWRGPAFADLPDRESAAARPEALRTTALYRRIEADLALGRAVEVVPELRELVAGDPLHEPFQAQLIRALSAAGRPADALTAYEDARRAIADRLGSRPGTELAGLHARLLRGDRPADARRGAADGRNGTGTPYGPPWGALDVPPAPGPAPGPASGVTADGGSPTRELRAPGIPAVGDRPPHDAPNAGSAPVSAPAPGRTPVRCRRTAGRTTVPGPGTARGPGTVVARSTATGPGSVVGRGMTGRR